MKSLSKKLMTVMMLLTVLSINLISSDTAYATSKKKMAFTSKVSSLKAGKSYTFKTNMPKADTKWKVSNTKIATISNTGKLTAKKVGKVTVTATYKKQKVTITVAITPKKIIGIDPGHQEKQNKGLEPIGPGSSTKKQKVSSGTQGVATKVPEYKLTLTIAKKLKTELENRGYQVVMTRTSNNVNISNKERALLLNKKKVDIAIRLHADGSTNRNTTGASSLYTSTANRYVSKSISKKSKKLSDAVISAYCKETKIKNRGSVVRNDLTGNNYSKVPTICFEMGFMSNAKEDRSMQTASMQTKMVKGLANGIDNYFK